MTPQQAQARLKDPSLSDHEREQIYQYLHYLAAEGVSAKPSPAARAAPRKNSRHTRHNPRAGQP